MSDSERPAVDPRLVAAALESHRRAAYEAGYARAIADVLTGSVFLAEQTLRDPQGPGDSRALLYRFVARLEKRPGDWARRPVWSATGWEFKNASGPLSR